MGLLNKKELTSSAEVIDEHLILSFPNAVDPIVWRMALNDIGTASFEIRQPKNSDTCKLVLKPKKGAAETIATFNEKEETLEALLHASNALQKASAPKTQPQRDGTITNTNTPTFPTNEKKGASKWLYLFIGFLIVIALYSYMASLMPKTVNDFGSSTQTNKSSQSQTGVPLSADEFLSEF